MAAELAAAGFTDAVEVGRGGGGVVYRCYQKSLGRSVAIKVLASDLDEDDRERFLREGYAMGALSGHPNIANILQVGVTESNRPFIVMPYHTMGSLADRVRREGRIAWPDALRIGVKLCGALETAHRTGTLHRDIKPANVLVNDYGEPQLSDFGTARIAGGYKTVTGFFTGTLSYTAPEVLAGNSPTVAADVYSLGATIYALIAGSPPHERKADEDLIAHYLRITSTPVPDLRPQGIPADVCAAIEKALSREPADRHASAEEFGRELQLAQRHNGLTPDPMALSEPAGQPGADGGHASAAARRSRPVRPVCPKRVPSAAGGTDRVRCRRRPRTCSRTPHRSVASSLTVAGASRADPRTTTLKPETKKRSQEDPDRLGGRRGGAAVGARRHLHRHVIARQERRPSRRTEPTDRRSAGQLGSRSPMRASPATRWRPPRPTAPSGFSAAWGRTTASADEHEGYDPAIDSWKSGEDLPVPVQHAMSVTWQDTPVVLGGWRTEGTNSKVATDRVWRVVNSRWTELPPLLQPTGGSGGRRGGRPHHRHRRCGLPTANLLNTTEIFDGTSWKLGAPIPTPRQMLGAASDGKLVYVLGGTNGTSDLATVETYDPAADTWTSLPELPGRRSDFGVAYTDGRLVVVGGMSAGPGPQERGRTRSRHAIVEWSAGLGNCAPRHGGGRCRERPSMRSAGRPVSATDRSRRRPNR